jgi:MFS family permease
MVLLLKPISEEHKDFVHKRICELAVLGVTTQNIQNLADTKLLSDCFGGDAGRVGATLALASSAGGAIEFLLNPIVGKISDDWGRKWVYYLGPAVSGVGMSILVLATEGKNLPVLLVHKALTWALVSQSCSFIAPITFSDMFAGQELGIRTASFFGSIGLSIFLFPPVAAFFHRRGSNLILFKLRLMIALVQCFYVKKFVPETLMEERRVKFNPSDVNPLSFLKLFRKSRTLRVLALALFFNCWSEGKNMAALRTIWQDGPPLRWSVEMQSLASMVYGASGIFAGKYLAPKLIRSLGNRKFTSLTNIMNTLGLAITGLPFPDHSTSCWIGAGLHVPGVNNTSAAAMKAVATEHAVANGFARGEYGGMYSSIRTLSMIIAPPVFGWAYQHGVSSTSKSPSVMRLALAWLLAAFFGAALPELLHRSLTDEDLKVPKLKAAAS